MVFDHSYNANVNGCVFNHVGGNQSHHNTYYFSLFNSGNTPCIHCSHQIQPTTHSRVLARSTYRSADAVFFVGMADRLIGKILGLLIDHKNSSNNHREWKPTLETLRQTLLLTERAIFTYDGRPLGISLTNVIAPEVEQCYALLLELHDEVHRTWAGFIWTRISSVWRQVFMVKWDHELVSLRRRLCHSRNLLAMPLLALNSYVLFTFYPLLLAETTLNLQSVVWMELGNESSAGRVSLKNFCALLKDQLPSFHSIRCKWSITWERFYLCRYCFVPRGS
jgi:hypothetical protein